MKQVTNDDVEEGGFKILHFRDDVIFEWHLCTSNISTALLKLLPSDNKKLLSALNLVSLS